MIAVLSRKSVVSVLLAGLLCMVGCAGGRAAPQVAPRALLDLTRASISLPLDAYAMTTGEENTVHAAQQIVFARCILKSSEVPAVTLGYASNLLGDEAIPDRWLYGYWNAVYVAAKGLDVQSISYGIGQGLDFSYDQAIACVNSDEYKTLNVIDGKTVTTSSDEDGASAGLLLSIGQGAYAQTVADARFKALAKTRASCITALGYAIDSASVFYGVAEQGDWSTQQRLQAALAEAQCSDQSDFTQQAADINATYQQVLIDEHEAELVVVQQTVRERVAHAETILRQVGLM